MEVRLLELTAQLLGVLEEVDVASTKAQRLFHPQTAIVHHAEQEAIPVRPRRPQHGDELHLGDHPRRLRLQRRREVVPRAQALVGDRTFSPGLDGKEPVVLDGVQAADGRLGQVAGLDAEPQQPSHRGQQAIGCGLPPWRPAVAGGVDQEECLEVIEGLRIQPVTTPGLAPAQEDGDSRA